MAKKQATATSARAEATRQADIRGAIAVTNATAAMVEGTRTGGREKSLIARRDGRTLRRLTLYLDPELARQVAVYGALMDIDLSAAISQLCTVALDTVKPKRMRQGV